MLPGPQPHEGAGSEGRDSEAGGRMDLPLRGGGRGGCAARPSQVPLDPRLRFLRAFRSAAFELSAPRDPLDPLTHTAEAEGAAAADGRCEPRTPRSARGSA